MKKFLSKIIIFILLFAISLSISVFSFETYANEETSKTYSKETNVIADAISTGKITINGIKRDIETIEISKEELEDNNLKWVVQSYLDDIPSKETNKIYRIVIPAGTYEIDRPLNIFSNTILDCSDPEGVDIYASNGCAILGGNLNYEASGYTGSENIILYGGKYHGVGKDINTNALNHKISGASSSCTIRFGHATNINIVGVTVVDNCGGHHIELGAIKELLVSDCEFYGYADPTNSSSSLSLEAIQLDVIHRENMNFAGYNKKDDFSIENAKIIHNYFHDIRRGVGSHHAVYGHPYNNIEISDNVFENMKDKAIQLEYFTNTTIKNNEITKSPAGISCGSIFAGSFYLPNDKKERDSLSVNKIINLNSKISNNTIILSLNPNSETGFDNSQYGIRIFGENLTASNNKSADELKDHGGSNATMPPNGLYYASGVALEDNEITTTDNTKSNTIDCGIRSFYTKNITIKNNNINIPKTTGITLLNATANTLSGNKISNSHNGISVNSSQKNTLDSNIISSIANNGVMIYKADIENLQGNKINSCGSNAISISEYSTVKNIRNNTINNVKTNGINIYKSTVSKISNNTITNVKKASIIILEKSKVTDSIYNNSINSGNTDAYAIGVFGSTANSISTNKVFGKNKSGIGIYNSSNVKYVKNNNIVSPNTYGIFVHNKSTTGSISGNTIKKSKKHGIGISEKSISKYFNNNKLYSCGYKNQIFISKNSKGLILNKSNLTLKKGKKETLKLTKPINSKIKWKSSNSKVATVNQSGKITAKKKGKATITASNQGITVKCYVKVK